MPDTISLPILRIARAAGVTPDEAERLLEAAARGDEGAVGELVMMIAQKDQADADREAEKTGYLRLINPDFHGLRQMVLEAAGGLPRRSPSASS